MKIILRFIKEKEFYKAVGKPYQIGFLLSGEPGCGKSSFIRALSNELNRSIKELKFNVIKDLYDLNKVMKCAEYKNIKMDCDKTIIVAEDVDACTDILYEREKHKPNSCNLNNPELMSAIRNYTNNDTTDNDNVDTNKNLEGFLKEIEKNNSKNKSKNSKDENKPTLSDILNITDGINSNDGRIMIFTTNHPDKLDKALIRPGRLDYHIVFGKMRKNVLYDMITNWYKKYDELVIFNKDDKADKADKADTKEESCYDKFISIWNEKNNEFIDEKLKPCDVACILQKYGKDVIYAINALIEKQTA
jgi:chaperone BCS1